eukprot:CAMPEP_0167795508 /NCGR_PEP_ID=MMETSP0111_2-20121227/14483_1 /TAXON_ID=91324 /ORGANISM="Lotharella globosa, Strain CCCM811" /LENGTH=209 /DNA_ID=CAMNT_0007689201 /DNA_START=1 /DNA_END=627 /DNA_ORIENTATION=-
MGHQQPRCCYGRAVKEELKTGKNSSGRRPSKPEKSTRADPIAPSTTREIMPVPVEKCSVYAVYPQARDEQDEENQDVGLHDVDEPEVIAEDPDESQSVVESVNINEEDSPIGQETPVTETVVKQGDLYVRLEGKHWWKKRNCRVTLSEYEHYTSCWIHCSINNRARRFDASKMSDTTRIICGKTVMVLNSRGLGIIHLRGLRAPETEEW